MLFSKMIPIRTGMSGHGVWAELSTFQYHRQPKKMCFAIQMIVIVLKIFSSMNLLTVSTWCLPKIFIIISNQDCKQHMIMQWKLDCGQIHMQQQIISNTLELASSAFSMIQDKVRPVEMEFTIILILEMSSPRKVSLYRAIIEFLSRIFEPDNL